MASGAERRASQKTRRHADASEDAGTARRGDAQTRLRRDEAARQAAEMVKTEGRDLLPGGVFSSVTKGNKRNKPMFAGFFAIFEA